MKIAIMFIAAILIMAPAIVTAQPPGPGINMDRAHLRPFVEPILIGHGFALNRDHYHILDVNAIKTSEVSPGLIRSLLVQKKSPEEIAKEINDIQMETKARGHLRFAGLPYSLNIKDYDNHSLTGDILTLPPYKTDLTTFTPTVVGHISLSTSQYEGVLLSTGTITMNGTNYSVMLTSPMILGKW